MEQAIKCTNLSSNLIAHARRKFLSLFPILNIILILPICSSPLTWNSKGDISQVRRSPIFLGGGHCFPLPCDLHEYKSRVNKLISSLLISFPNQLSKLCLLGCLLLFLATPCCVAFVKFVFYFFLQLCAMYWLFRPLQGEY